MAQPLPDMPKKILVIDDDERLQGAAKDFFQSHGFEVHALMSGKAVLEGLELYQPDIILLDVMMPGEDGFSVLRKIRSASSVPVIMLTARGEDTDRIVGLELGADDYLPKPFNPRELLARIKAVLRRFAPEAEGAERKTQSPQERPPASAVSSAYASQEVREGAYVLDSRRQSLSRGEKRAALSTAEFCILHALMTHAGTVLGREQLLVLSFGRDDYSSPRNIDVYISRIRSLLRRLGERTVRIRTVWGAGYCWIKGE